MGNRAPRQDGFRPVTAAWLGKRIGAEVRGQNGPIFDHFPIPSALTLDKCRQLGVSPYLGFARKTLGSVRSTSELRPLVVSDCTQE